MPYSKILFPSTLIHTVRLVVLVCIMFFSWTSWVYAASPQINNAPVLTGTVGEYYTYDLGVTDADNDISHYSLYVNPHHPDIQISSTGVITWNLDEHNDAGKYFIVATVRDDENNSDDVRYHLTINDPNNRDPIINNLPVTEATVGVPYRYDLGATDADGDTLRYSLYVWPSNPGITLSEDGVVNWTPTEHNQAGEYAVTVSVYDDNNGSNLVRYKLNAFDPNNNIPVINHTPVLTATVGVPYTFNAAATDPDGDTLTYSLYHWPSSADSQLSQDGVFTWTPSIDDMIGRHAVTITVDDGNNGVESLRYQIDLSIPADIDGDGLVNEEDPFPEDPSNGADLNWVFCSNHGAECRPNAPSIVRYGDNGNYFYRRIDELLVRCHDSVFGLIYGSRHCDYLLSDTEDYDGDGVVDSADAFPSDATETHDSDGDGLGDNRDVFPTDASNGEHLQWVFCSDHGAECRPNAPSIVRYGDNGNYFYQRIDELSVRCHDSVFGLIYGSRHCDYLLSDTDDYDGDGVVDSADAFPSDATETQDTDGDGLGDNIDLLIMTANNTAGSQWVFCINEWGTCQVPVPTAVRYGANNTYDYKYATESIACNSDAFDDPTPYVFKHCQYLLSAAEDFDGDGLVDSVDPYPADPENNISSTHWVHCANENEACQLNEELLVRYGSQGNYHFQIASSDTVCDHSSFGAQSLPESANACHYLQVSPIITNEKKQGWFDVGAEGSSPGQGSVPGQGSSPSISMDNNGIPYVVYADSANSWEIFVKRFNGTSWETVGNEGVAVGRVTHDSISFDNNNVPYVAYTPLVGEEKIVVKRFNGISWEVVGAEGFLNGYALYTSIRIDSNNIPYVAYVDAVGSKRVIVKRFNGADWEIVGTEYFSQGIALDLSIIFDGNDVPYVIYSSDDAEGSQKSVVERFNGTSWEVVGEENSFPVGAELSIGNNNIPYIVYADSMNSWKTTIKRFNGTTWEVVGEEGFLTARPASLSITMSDNNVLYRAYMYYASSGEGQASVERFNGSVWETMGEEEFSDIYDFSMSVDNYVPYMLYKKSEDLRQILVKRYYDGTIGHNVFENQISAIDVNATDIYNNSTLHYSLIDSHDASLFAIDEDTGIVTFVTPPDFENPQDSDQDNVHVFEVKVTNEWGASTLQEVKIVVLNDNPTLTTTRTTTMLNSVTVEVNGQPGSQVFVNGIDTGEILDSNGVVNVELDTSGEVGDKVFNITLRDTLGNTSEALSTIINRQSAVAPVITNDKKQEGWSYVGAEGTSVGQGSFSSIIGIDNNDIPYIVYPDRNNSNKIVVKRFNGTIWEIVGDQEFSESDSSLFSISFDNNNVPYVAYAEALYDYKVSVKRFNGTDWEMVGNGGLSIDSPHAISISIDNNNVPYVAYSDSRNSGKVTVKRFNGVAWEIVGAASFSEGIAFHLSIIFDNNNVPYVAYNDVTNSYNLYKGVVKRFNGAVWEDVGEELFSASFSGNISMSMDGNNVPYVAYSESGGSYKAVVKRFNGTAWQVVGQEDFSNGSALYLSISISSDNIPYVAYAGGVGLGFRVIFVQRFNGTVWEPVGDSFFSNIYSTAIVLDSKNVPYVMYSDNRSTSKGDVKRFYDGSIDHSVFENQTAVIDINATDIYNNSTLHYSLIDSYDASLFTINESNGVVTFVTAPNFENPQDNNQDNIYIFEVEVTNEQGASTLQKVNVTVVKDQPTLTTTPTSTALDGVIVEVNGQPGNQVFVNGIDTGEILDSNGVVSIELDTSGEDGDKVFSLTLKDQEGNEGGALTVTIVKDTIAPNAPTLTTIPTTTMEDFVSLEVNGEIGSQVFVSGVDSGKVIASSGTALIAFDTSGELGDKVFIITLKDTTGNISEPLSFAIEKQSAEPPTITNVKKQGWFDLGPESSFDVKRNVSSTSTVLDQNDMLYIVYERDGDELLVKRFNGSFWEAVGTEGFETRSNINAITFDNNNIPYVFYRMTNGFIGNGSGVVKRFNGSAWEVVGDQFPLPDFISNLSILFDNNNVPYLAYSDSDQVVVKRFNGTVWESLGSETHSQGYASNSLAIDSNNVLYLTYTDTENSSKAVVKRFNGTSWENLSEPGGLSQGPASKLEMRVDNNNTPYVYYTDVGLSWSAVVKRFNGTAWEDVPAPSRPFSDPSLTIDDDNNLYMTYRLGDKNDLQRFNGTSWEVISDEGFGVGTLSNFSINLDSYNNPHITYVEFGLNVLHTKKFYDGSILHNVYEGSTTAIDIDATDIDNRALEYSLIDSYDASLFSIDENNGVVTFNTAPYIENPQDNDQNNVYVFEVQVTNELNVSTMQRVELTILRNDAPSLTTTPTITSEETVTVEVNGNEPGEEVFVNSVGTGVTLSADKKATVTLDTSGEDGDKNFSITLNQSGSDYFSNSLFVSILKDTAAPTLISRWPENNNTIGLSHTNQLELAYIFADENGIASIKIYDSQGNDISDSAIIDAHSLVLTLTPEQDGHYSYTVIAEDSLGNQKEVISSFEVVRYAPETVTSLPGGLYNEPVEVDLISSSEATIYYSTDGYPPMVGAANTQQGASPIKNIAISSTTNLQYFAIDIAGNREETKSAVYRFSGIDDYNQSITASYDALNNQVNLSWSNDPDAQEYKVYRVASKLDLEVLQNSKAQQYLAPAAYLLATSSVNSFTDTAISNAANYHYVISKVNAEGIETLVSEPVRVSVEPTNIAADVDDAITRAKNWLYSTQNVDGSWGSNKRLTLLETTSALDALHSVSDNNQYAINKALGQVLGAYADNNDYLARQIFTLSTYNFYTNDKVNKLLSQSHFNDNAINGWGLLKRYKPNALDSALAVKALKTSNTNFKKHIGYDWTFNTNTNVVNENGYWSLVAGGDTSIYVSAFVYSLLESNVEDYTWITQAQNLDGSFGNGLLDTLGVVLYLELSTEQLNQALAYIISLQSTMGDINNNSYLTALALQALSQGVK